MEPIRKVKFVISKGNNILRSGFCSESDLHLQADKNTGEKVKEIPWDTVVDDVRMKMMGGEVVDKSEKEIEEAEKVLNPEIPEEMKQVVLTKKDYDSILRRIEKLEKKRIYRNEPIGR